MIPKGCYWCQETRMRAIFSDCLYPSSHLPHSIEASGPPKSSSPPSNSFERRAKRRALPPVAEPAYFLLSY